RRAFPAAAAPTAHPDDRRFPPLHRRPESAAPTECRRARSIVPAPDRAGATPAPTIATAPSRPTRQPRQRALRSASRRSTRARVAYLSSQREPSLDGAAVGESDLDANPARHRARAEERPVVGPAAIIGQLQNAKAGDAVDERVRRRLRRGGVVESRPVQHVDVTVVKAVTDTLTPAARLLDGVRTGAGEHERRVAGRLVRACVPRGLVLSAVAHAARNRRT